MLDTVREVYTPEGVALRLPAAGPIPRAVAWVIDFCIRMALLMVCSMVFGMLGRAGMGFYLVCLFVVVWLYPVVCEGLWDGQTPGKRVLHLRVISSDGAPVGWLATCVRNLMRTVDMLPFGYACGLVSGLLDPWGRRLGDLVAGTLVVDRWAYTAHPDWQQRGLGTVTKVILAIAGVLYGLMFIAVIAAIVIPMALQS